MSEAHVLTQRIFNRSFKLLVVMAIFWNGLLGMAYSASESAAESSSPTKQLSETIDKHLQAVSKDKQEFKQYIQEQFHDLEDKMQALREKSTNLHETTQAKLNEKIETLKDRKKEIFSKIEDFRTSSENTWKDIRENILNSMNDLQESLPQLSPSP